MNYNQLFIRKEIFNNLKRKDKIFSLLVMANGGFRSYKYLQKISGVPSKNFNGTIESYLEQGFIVRRYRKRKTNNQLKWTKKYVYAQDRKRLGLEYCRYFIKPIGKVQKRTIEIDCHILIILILSQNKKEKNLNTPSHYLMFPKETLIKYQFSYRMIFMRLSKTKLCWRSCQ